MAAGGTHNVVYGLIDPRTGQLRYVGKTQGKPEIRLARHISEATKRQKDAHTRKNRWIRSILQAGAQPEVETIEEVPGIEELGEAEQFWIAYYRAIGCDLTNATLGGDGAPGYRAPREVRAKISHIAKTSPKSIANRKAINEMLRGKPLAPEHRAKLSKAHKESPLERAHLATITAANRGRQLREEHRARISESLKKYMQHSKPACTGQAHSEEHKAKIAAACREYWRRKREGAK